MNPALSPFLFTDIHPEKIQQHYAEHGLIYLEDYFCDRQLAEVKEEIKTIEAQALQDLVDHWNGEKVTFFTKNPVSQMTLEKKEDFVTTDYFQKSAEASHVFFEEIQDELVINRIGHGMHLDPMNTAIHQSIYENSQLQALLKSIGYVHPICLLSVYIPKLSNGFGSDVRPHQESSFAHTTPLSSLVLWIALEDATLENACMWGLPESHRLPLKYVSKVDHVQKKRDYFQINETKIPEFELKAPYVPLEVKAGDALLFHGNFVHCSPQNNSLRSRKALTFQFVETHEVKFESFNWIRTPNSKILY